MGEHILTGQSGQKYPIQTGDINWNFDSTADAMDESADVVLILLKICDDGIAPVDIMYHAGPISHYFRYRALDSHIVKQKQATEYATIYHPDQWVMERIAQDLIDGYSLR